jgi:ribosomal protein S27E
MERCPKCGMVGTCWCFGPEDGKPISCRRCGAVLAYGDTFGNIRVVEVLIDGQIVDEYGHIGHTGKYAPYELSRRFAEVMRRRGSLLPRNVDSRITCYECGKQQVFHSVKVVN